jgi:hypothetical protein
VPGQYLAVDHKGRAVMIGSIVLNVSLPGSKKGCGCKCTLETIQLYTWTQIKVKKQCFYCCSTFQSQ